MREDFFIAPGWPLSAVQVEPHGRCDRCHVTMEPVAVFNFEAPMTVDALAKLAGEPIAIELAAPMSMCSACLCVLALNVRAAK